MSDKYNDGVLDEKFSRVEELMSAHFEAHTSILKEIQGQTTRTNGRVTLVEKLIWTGLGALPLLTGWSGWMTNEILAAKESLTPVQQAAINEAVREAIRGELKALDE